MRAGQQQRNQSNTGEKGGGGKNPRVEVKSNGLEEEGDKPLKY